MYWPTSSHISAPSNDSIVTSNWGLFFLTQVQLLEKRHATVHDDTDGIVIDCGIRSCEADGNFKVFCNRWVKADDSLYLCCRIYNT